LGIRFSVSGTIIVIKESKRFSSHKSDSHFLCLLSDNSSEQLNETSDNMDDNTMSTQDGHTLPILKKILDLSTKAQVNFECWFICFIK